MIQPVHPLPPFLNKAVTKARAQVFKPVGRCIYCSDGEPPFTREHIVPSGLGGGLILPQSSCERCRKTTQEVETYVLRGLLLSHRLNVGLVQHRDDLGETLPLRFKGGERDEVRRFPVDDFPHYLALPHIYGAPGILSGGSPGQYFNVSFKCWGVEEELRALNETGNAMLVHDFDMRIFARALAKIAHSLAAADIGIENFDPVLPELILGRSPELASYFVGEWTDPYNHNPPHVPLHQVGLGMQQWGQRWLASVRIKLFAAQENAPVYKVVVGELIESPELLAKFGLWPLSAPHLP